MAALLAPAHVALFPATVRNILVVVNGLQDHRAIAQRLARIHDEESVRIHLLAVETPPSGHAMAFLKGIDVKRVLHEDGLKRMRGLRDLLDAGHVPYRHHVEVGRWEETIAEFARDHFCKSIVMGENRASLLRNLVLRYDAWRVRSRLGRSGFACEMI